MRINSSFLCFLLFISFFCFLNSFKFVSVSDLHVGSNNCSFWNDKKQRVVDSGKLMVRNELLKYFSYNNDVDLFLMVGDLTENGFKNGNNVFQNEWLRFINEWFSPIAQIIGIEKITLCVGNHDAGCPSYPNRFKSNTIYEIFDAVKKLNYSFFINDVLFICCGIYPNEDIRRELKDFLTVVNYKVPIIIFFHYSIFQKCKRMNDSVRYEFYNVIKDHNVIGIINGHFHCSFSDQWNDIPVIGVGGHSYTICYVENNKLKTKVVYAKK